MSHEVPKITFDEIISAYTLHVIPTGDIQIDATKKMIASYDHGQCCQGC